MLGKKRKVSWQEAVEEYCKLKSGKRSWRHDIYYLKKLHPHFGDVKDLNEITRKRVASIVERPGVSLTERTTHNSTANRAVSVVRALMNLAETKWEFIERAPKYDTYPEVIRDMPRSLSPEEWFKLEAALPDYWRRPATFALATGLREARVYGLRWDDLAKHDRGFSFTGHGKKLGNCIPLNQTALDVIEECRRLPLVSSTHVFNYKGQPIQRHGCRLWGIAIEEAKIPYLRWHDLRVTFNTWLADAEVPQEIRKRLMGHAVGHEVQERYTAGNIDRLRKYAAVIDEVLAQHKNGTVAKAG